MEHFLSRAMISMAAAVAAMILASIAAVFLGGALYLFLVSLSAAPPLAAALVGLAGLVLAGLIILAARIASRSGRASRTSGNTGSSDVSGAGDINDLAAKLGGLAARELTAQAQAHPYRAVVVSLLAGLAVGGIPELRKTLESLVKK